MAVSVMPEDEGFLAVDDAGRLEFRGNAPGGVAGMQQDEGLSRGLGRSEDCPREPACGRQQHSEDEPEQLAHNELSLDDEGVGRVGFAGSMLTLVSRGQKSSGQGPGARNARGESLAFGLVESNSRLYLVSRLCILLCACILKCFRSHFKS